MKKSRKTYDAREAPFAATSNPNQTCVYRQSVKIGYPRLSAHQTTKTVVHLIIGILIGIVFFILLAKALIETVWGLCLIAYGTGCHALALILIGLAKIIRAYDRITK